MRHLGDADVVVFVEDPGAINCIVPLIEELQRRRVSIRLWGQGLGLQLLYERGLQPLAWERGSSAEIALAHSPGLLLVGTSENLDSPAFELVRHARRSRIPSAAILDSATNAAYRFRGRTESALAHVPDWLLVPDERAHHSFARLGFPDQRIRIVGHPGGDHLRHVLADLERLGHEAVRRSVLRAKADRVVLVFVSEISGGLDPAQYVRSEEYTLRGRGGAELRTEIVVEELLDAIVALEGEGVPRPYLVLRRHPKETDADLGALAAAFDEVSAGVSPYHLIYAADVVVGMSSMLLLEAHLFGVPTLAILPRACEREWLEPVHEGRIPSAVRRDAVVDALRTLLTDPSIRRVGAFAAGGAGTGAVDRMIEVITGITA